MFGDDSNHLSTGCLKIEVNTNKERIKYSLLTNTIS